MIDLTSGSQVSQWEKLKYIIHSSDLFKSFRTVVIYANGDDPRSSFAYVTH